MAKNKMRIIKFILTLLCFMIFLIAASLVHIVITVIRPSYRWPLVSHLTRLLIKSLCFILGAKITLEGRVETLKEKGLFIISRHVGYIDGLVLGSLLPLIFVSKKEIKKWPFIGGVVQISGTIFVDRQHKTEIRKCLEEIAQTLRNKLNVLVFPEGTSSDGTGILPFQSSFFAGPIMTQAPIVPIVIHYQGIDGKAISPENRNELYWYNRMNFSRHVWNLLRYRKIDVRVTVHDKILTNVFNDTSTERKKLAWRCHQMYCDYTGSDKNYSEEIYGKI